MLLGSILLFGILTNQDSKNVIYKQKNALVKDKGDFGKQY
jgi:hypothetical protein